MPIIRSDAHTSDGSGNHTDYAFSYACFAQVIEAMEELRGLNAPFGYYYRMANGKETYNLGTNQGGDSPRLRADNIPTGVAQPYKVTTKDAPTPNPGRKVTLFAVRQDDEGELLRLTNCSASTMNAMAKALAAGASDNTGAIIPKLTEGWLPKKFNDYWNIVVLDPADIDSAAKKEEWGQGSARAIQEFNLGVQVDPLKLLRGDAIQLGSKASSPHHGHSVYCYATRRMQKDEVRLVFLSSQIDTFGVGVRLNDLARQGILSQGVPSKPMVKLKFKLVGDGEVLAQHRYQVQVGSEIYSGKSGDDGRVTLEIPADAKEGTLSFWLPDEDDEEEDEPITWPLRLSQPTDEGGESADAGPEGRARLEWVVSKSGEPYENYVYHPGSFLSGRFVTHAHRYGRWQVLRKGDEDKHKLFTPWKGHPHAARLYHEFPRYPIALGGSNDLNYFNVNTGETADVSFTSQLYYRNGETLKGGYFPMGRSRIWHNGVHLEPEEEGATAYAPFDGRVVAARLCDPSLLDDQGEKKFPHGSGNFVLLKHKAKIGGTETEFFSLLMHVAYPDLTLQGNDRLLTDEAARIPWLREIALAPDRDEDKDEAQNLDWKALYLKVYKLPSPAVSLGDKELQVGDILKVADAAVTEAQWKTLNGLAAGTVTRVSDDAEGELDPKAFNEAGGLVAPYDAYPCKYIELKDKLLKGEVVDLWEEELIVRCGDPVGATGTWHGKSRLHFEIFSSSLIQMKIEKPAQGGGDPTWEAKSQVDFDSADDKSYFYERKKFLEDFFAAVEEKANQAAGLDGQNQKLEIRGRMLADIVCKDDGAILREVEAQQFFKDPNNSLLSTFRNLIVRHLSEWGTKVQWENLDQAKDALGKPLEATLKKTGQAAANYAWWTDGFGKDAGLPDEQVAHFYNPVTFLLWLEHERMEELPKGAGDELHKSVLDLSTYVEGPQEGGPSDDADDTAGKKVRLRLKDEEGDPLEGIRYELKVGDETFSGNSGSGGLVEHPVNEDATEGELKFWVEEDDEEPHVCPIRIS